ncbi:MAG: hypothetical protein K2K07_02815 [Lachnospiraceae bacterium]|nr:hypothetical protein [Lachnospiraceae bacterium]
MEKERLEKQIDFIFEADKENISLCIMTRELCHEFMENRNKGLVQDESNRKGT